MLKAKSGADVLVVNAMGRVFMTELDCPFRAVDNEISACALKHGADAILIDFHAEATSEKQAMGLFLDGRVSVVVGTHTHTPTADARILSSGTAYMSDAGMCGDYNSVLGMDPEEPINRFLTRIPRGRYSKRSDRNDFGICRRYRRQNGFGRERRAFAARATPRASRSGVLVRHLKASSPPMS